MINECRMKISVFGRINSSPRLFELSRNGGELGSSVPV